MTFWHNCSLSPRHTRKLETARNYAPFLRPLPRLFQAICTANSAGTSWRWSPREGRTQVSQIRILGITGVPQIGSSRTVWNKNQTGKNSRHEKKMLKTLSMKSPPEGIRLFAGTFAKQLLQSFQMERNMPHGVFRGMRSCLFCFQSVNVARLTSFFSHLSSSSSEDWAAVVWSKYKDR